MTPDGALSVFRADSGRTNGNTFDAHGRLISCEGAEFGPGGRRRVVRTDLKTGRDRGPDRALRGQALQQPQRRRRRRPRAASGSPTRSTETTARALEMDAEAVYRIDSDGRSRACCRSRRSSAPTGWRSRPTPDALRHRQPHPAGRQSQDLGVRRRRRTAGRAASAWSSTSAGAAAATACGSTSAATSGSPPGSCSRATPARRPTCRRAST